VAAEAAPAQRATIATPVASDLKVMVFRSPEDRDGKPPTLA
jgi:hypothetical protein